LYLGAGAGINCNFGTSAILSGRRFDCNCLLPPSTVSFPLFAYFRANFANRRVSPFFALSAGGELSPKQTLKLDLYEIPYSAHSILIEPQLGLNIRTTTKSSLYLAVGLNNRIVPCCFSYTGYSAVLGYGYTAGVQLHFGFTF
jgi:hypothetical protein